MAYREVEGSVSNAWDFDQNNVLEGVYINKRINVGPNNSCLYEIRQANSEVVAVWGSTVIDFRMTNVPLNSQVKIEYIGKVKNPKTGRQFKEFKVFVDDEVKTESINAELETTSLENKEKGIL